jgi:hypothetical protein
MSHYWMVGVAAVVLASTAVVGGAQATDSSRASTGKSDASSSNKWVYSDVKDDFSNKADQRLTILAEDSVAIPAGFFRPQLVVSCGDAFRNQGHRAMLVFTGVPLQVLDRTMMGGTTRVEIRFDGDSKPSGHNVVLFDKSGTTFYVGDFSGFYFSGGFFKSMLQSRQVRIRYSPLLGDNVETATFDVVGFADALPKLSACDWPRP